MLKLKVCGMKNQQNITDLEKVNPDFTGLIFHQNSKRNVDNSKPIKLSTKTKYIGVFVSETESFILDHINEYNLKYIQLHGNESPHFCKKIKDLNRHVVKAFNINLEFDFSKLKDYEPYCDYFLFDTKGEKAGGNGFSFDWKLLDKYKGKTPFFLSGGIDEKSVSKIKKINHKMFMGVDINSKFEIEPGLKDINKIKKFRDELFS